MSERLAESGTIKGLVEKYGSLFDRKRVTDVLRRVHEGLELENLEGVELAHLSVVVEKILGVNGLRRAILNSFEWAKWETFVQDTHLGFRLNVGRESFELSYLRTGDSFSERDPVGILNFPPDQEELNWSHLEGETSLHKCGVLPRARQILFAGTQIVLEESWPPFSNGYDFAVILTPTINSYRCEIIEDSPGLEERQSAFAGINRVVEVDQVFQRKALARFLSGVFN